MGPHTGTLAREALPIMFKNPGMVLNIIMMSMYEPWLATYTQGRGLGDFVSRTTSTGMPHIQIENVDQPRLSTGISQRSFSTLLATHCSGNVTTKGTINQNVAHVVYSR